MGVGLPNVVIDDMQLHAATRIIRAFTHGRSIWELNLDDLEVTDVAEDQHVPFAPKLSQNYPNPFNPTTEIRYRVPGTGHVTLKIYNIVGQEVSTLVDEVKQPGTYTVEWDAGGMPSGVYFCRLEAGNFVQSRKMLLLK